MIKTMKINDKVNYLFQMFLVIYTMVITTINKAMIVNYLFQEFPANGSLIPLPLLPYSCVRLAMTSATWKVDSISVTLYYPGMVKYFIRISGISNIITLTKGLHK